MMIVRLIAHTPEPEKVVAAAAKLCYSDAHITDLLDGLDEEKTAKFRRYKTSNKTWRFRHQIYTDISNCRCGFRLMSGTGFCTGYYFERP